MTMRSCSSASLRIAARSSRDGRTPVGLVGLQMRIACVRESIARPMSSICQVQSSVARLEQRPEDDVQRLHRPIRDKDLALGIHARPIPLSHDPGGNRRAKREQSPRWARSGLQDGPVRRGDHVWRQRDGGAARHLEEIPRQIRAGGNPDLEFSRPDLVKLARQRRGARRTPILRANPAHRVRRSEARRSTAECYARYGRAATGVRDLCEACRRAPAGLLR